MKNIFKNSISLVIIGFAVVAGSVHFLDREERSPLAELSSVAPSGRTQNVLTGFSSATEGSPSLLSERQRRTRSAQRLSEIPDPTIPECLETLASSPREPERALAAQLLGRRVDEPGAADLAVPVLLTALENDERPRVRLVAARALGLYGPAAAEAIPALIVQLHHHTMGDIAAQALGRIGLDAKAAIEPLVDLARDERLMAGSRIMAIEALVKIGGADHPEIASLLRAAAKDSDPEIGLTARRALTGAEMEVSNMASPG